MQIQTDSAGRQYVAAEDLTPEQHTRILLILEDEVTAAYGTKTDPIVVATRAAERVEARAIVTGTDPEAAEVIRNSAIKIYADLLAHPGGA